jgi:hypothetical protein
MIGGDRDFRFNRLQGYCLYPIESVTEEIATGQHEKYRIITVDAQHAGWPIYSDNNCYAVKKVYEMELQEFIEWIPSVVETGEKIITIERNL